MKYFFEIENAETGALRVLTHDGIIESVWVDVSGGDKAFWYDVSRTDEIDAEIYAAMRDGTARKI